MLEGLIGLILVLAVVTVVGHGLWVAAAAILRRADAAPRAEPPLGRLCPRCRLPLSGPSCRACDWPAAHPAAERRPHEALEVLRAQIEGAAAAGVLDPQAVEHMLLAIAEERTRLAEASAAHAAAARQVVEPIIAAEVVDEPTAPQRPPAAALRERDFVSEVPLRQRAERLFAPDAPDPAAGVPATPLPPRTTWADWLAAFMEERNIRWGELVGGLLIVCSSIALVISFWSEIADRPLVKFLLFNGVTAGLFGVGFYSEHRWRLRTTSRGLLTIGSLLVPLNFLAIAAFTTAAAANSPVTLAGEAFSVALFCALLYYAGRVLVADNAAALVCGVIAPSLAQLLVRRFADAQSTPPILWSLAVLPLAGYWLTNGWTMARAAARPGLDEDDVNRLFRFLGVTSFAVLLPLALLLFKTQRPLATLHELSVGVSLLGAVPLAAGLLVWRRLAGDTLAGPRTAGTSVGVFGALVSLAGLVVGWPDPSSMLPTALVEFAVFTVVAWRAGLPAGHLVAAACLAVSYLLGVYLVDDQIVWRGQDAHALADTIVSGRTGVLLPPLVLAYASAALVALGSAGRGTGFLASTGGVLAVASGGLASVSVALVSWFGFGHEGDPLGAAWVYLVYAAGSIGLAARDRRAAISWIGAALLLAAVVQGVVFRYGAVFELDHAEVPALLVYGTLCAAVALAVRARRLAVADSPLVEVLWTATLASSLAAAGWLAWLAPKETAQFLAGCWLWLALVWLAVALATRWLPVWALAKVALCAATVFGMVSTLEQRAWFLESPRPWLDPWTLQAVGTALAGLSLLWTALRIAWGRLGEPRFERDAGDDTLLNSPWLATDRALAGALVALVLAIAMYAAAPGAMQELSPLAAGPNRVVPAITNFEIPGIPHDHAAQWGSWVLLAMVLLAVAAIVLELHSTAWLLTLIVVSAAACPLVASRFEGEVAVASALRWASAAFLLCGTLPIWGRNWIAARAARWGWPVADGSLASQARAAVLVMGLVPPAAMLLTLGITTISGAPAGSLPWDSYGVIALVSLALVGAAGLWTASDRFFSSDQRGSRAGWSTAATALAAVLGAAPIVAMAIDQIGGALVRSPILGPEPSSAFARMGLAASYGLPMLLTALVLVGYAVFERSTAFALSGGLTLNAAATAGYLLAAGGSSAFEAATWIRLAQLNASLAACYLLAWLAMLLMARRRIGQREPIDVDFQLATQAALAPALLMLVLGWAWCDLLIYPAGHLQQPHVMPAELADAWGWISLALAAATSAAAAWAAGRRTSMAAIFAGLVALAVMAAAVAARWDIGDWVSYNTLLVGHALVAALLLAVAWRDRRTSTMAIDLARAMLFVLAARELFDNRWWPAAGFAALAVTGAAAAWIFQRRRYLYDASLMVNVAGSLAWIESKYLPGFENFVFANVILLALPVVPWLVIERLSIGRRAFRSRFEAPPMHRLATRLAILVLGIWAAIQLIGDAELTRILDADPRLPWAALAASAVAAVAGLWDARAGDSIARLYVLGLVAIAMLLDAFDLAPPWLLWTGDMVLGAYALATSYLWSRRQGLRILAARLGISHLDDGELAGLAWLVPSNLLLVAAIVALTGIVQLTERDISLRVLAAQATLAQVVSVALVARGDRRGVLQTIALSLGGVASAMFGWAWLDPATSGTLLHSLVVMAVALAAVAALYGLGLGKLLRETSDWLLPARRLTPWLAGLAALSIAATLGVEIYQFSSLGEVQIAWPAILAVGLTLAGLSAAALAAAVLPGRDPLNLSERGRTLYVYGAEVLLALVFVHVRLTMPWLFGGIFQRYWPLVVMAIAFLGVGFAELCRRYRQNVLAEPVENTGALLPVLPVLGFWATETRVDYSLLLLSVGVLYAGLSIARRSFGFGVLAALAANGGLWYFLERQEGFGFLAHPQIWLIPPALCILAAAYLNRAQLSAAQMTSVRYFTSIVVYLSSTGDIFINGVAQAPWLPVVLAGLSIVGILAGIALRVRAFLLLGTSFLGLALFTIIWHAAVDLDQTWIWYASGIISGVLIYALFAIFEKKRQEVLAAFERIKQWEG